MQARLTQLPGHFDASDRAIRRAVGFAPELSSAGAGWSGVALYGWRGQCREAMFEPFAEPVIVYHVGGAQDVGVRVGRRWDLCTHPGLLTVIPPHTRVDWDIRGEVYSRSVHLGPQLFGRAAGESDHLPAFRFRCGESDPLLIAAIHALEQELCAPGQRGTLTVDSASAFMAERLQGEPVLRSARRGVLGARPLARVLERIEASIEPGVSLQVLAEECGLSRAYFAAAFRAATGQSAHRYLTQRRLLRARNLLRDGELTLAQIALRCGFSSQAHFSDAFRREIGHTPSAFRRRLS